MQNNCVGCSTYMSDRYATKECLGCVNFKGNAMKYAVIQISSGRGIAIPLTSNVSSILDNIAFVDTSHNWDNQLRSVSFSKEQPLSYFVVDRCTIEPPKPSKEEVQKKIEAVVAERKKLLEEAEKELEEVLKV